MFRKMPIILLAIILAIIFLDRFIPYELKSVFYALSLSIKSVIIFCLPFIIFMLLFKTLSKLASQATKMILFILLAVCCSNFLSTMISYQMGSLLYHVDLSITLPQEAVSLYPAWNFSLPKLVANDHAMFAGVILGLLCSLLAPKLANNLSQRFDKIVSSALKMITFMIPFFIAGFVMKLIQDKVMDQIIQDYAVIFILVALAQFSYIFFIYFLSNKGQVRPCLNSMKNIMPASLAGFCSMSSAAAMPLTIIGAEKNANTNLTKLAIPATVNTHLIGDCFAIPIFAFAILKNFGAPEPAFLAYAIFAFYFVMAKFSVAAIPGGGIIVMLPILESHLGFNAEMSSLITALYILFDPVITSANVLGNGGFALGLNKLKELTIRPTIINVE